MSATETLSNMLFDKSSKAATDLLEWYSIAESSLDVHDFRRLAKLYNHGRFHAWSCPSCGCRVRYGDPVDWSEFQGANDADYTAYPGSPEIFGRWLVSRQCDECRLRRFMSDDDLELVGKGYPTVWQDNEYANG